MKKMLIILSFVSILFAQDLLFTNNNWRADSTNRNFQFAFNYASDNSRHFYFEKEFQINTHVKVLYGGVFSNVDDLASTLIRPDFPLFSNARAYRGEIQINYKNIDFNIGRHLFDQDPMKQNSIWNKKRLTTDGINWTWNLPLNFKFENTIESLPTEIDSVRNVYDRILNYHSLSWKYKNIKLSGGEISIYSGYNQGVNLLQSNPFLPYMLNMLDTYDKWLSGYSADNENIIFTFKLKYNFLENLYFQSILYIDDIQIDAVDRVRIADMFLLTNELFFKFNDELSLNLNANIANPVMGWHGGPYTDMLIHGIELLPHEYGEIYRYGLKIHYHKKWFETYLNVYCIHKAYFNTLEGHLFFKSIQATFPRETIYHINLRTGFYIFDNLALWGQVKYKSDEDLVFNFILQTYF